MTQTTPRNPPRLAERSTAAYVLRLVPLILLTEVVALELSLVYPALQHMAAEFRTESIGWTLTVVSLVGVVAQPLLGKVADGHGKKRVIVYAAGVFAVGSLVCALAPNFPVFLVGRAAQGVAMVIAPAAYGLIRDVFPVRVVPVAMGAITTGIGFSVILGPVVGGALVQSFGFRAIFWFCLLYAVVLAPLVSATFPESGVRLRRPVDVAGGLLFGCGAAGVLLAVGQGSKWGWGSGRLLAVAVGACVLLALFVVCELRAADPLIDLRLLTGPALRWTLLAALGGSVAIGGVALTLPQLVQTPENTGFGLGMAPIGVAVFLVPQGLLSAAGGPLGGLLARRRAPRTGLLIALGCLATAATLLSVLHTRVWHILLAALFMGIGFGFFFVSVSNLVVEAVPATHTGVGAGMMGVANNLGNATGVTVLGAVLAQHVLDTPGDEVLYGEAGYVSAFLVAAGFAAMALLVAAFMRHGRTPATGGVGAVPRENGRAEATS
ncbi:MULTISPECIES: MFS transporter [unclassified Streptomyces]|uniref:MFS transporter n=1 Tax=unclassified Streptomyces TaxID=2593676 RepID=UPI00278BE68B|nr:MULTISPECIES: MFS transporter [unclassified Streptomyces]